MKKSYLIVKTGRSGSRLNELFDTEIPTDNGSVKLCNTRLTGSWYQSIIKSCKSAGITGTLSVLPHDPEVADLLLKSYQQSYLQLKNNIDWRVVARIDATEDELSDASSRGRQAGWEKLAQDGKITVTKRDRDGIIRGLRYNITREPGETIYSYNSRLKDLKKFCKDSANDYGAEGVKDLIQIL